MVHCFSVFSFGIGEGASSLLVKGIARAGRGKVEFVLQDDQITGMVRNYLTISYRCSLPLELSIDIFNSHVFLLLQNHLRLTS